MTKNLGIHQFKNYSGSSSFFVQREFGNYLFCADFLHEFDYDFFKSKGGVYRMFLESPKNISKTHASIFVRFGAAAVFSSRDQLPGSADLPCEVFGDEFVDHTLRWVHRDQFNCVLIKQKGKKIAFFGSSCRLGSLGRVFDGENEITEPVLQFMQSQQISFGFFARHEGNAFLQPHAGGFLQSLYKWMRK